MKTLYLLLPLLVMLNQVARAEFDVDQADSLDFESFHQDKDSTIKLWEQKKPKAEEATPLNTKNNTDGNQPSDKTSNASNVSGKKFEARERYTLIRSTQTPYSAFYVIEALHRQMAKSCPKGWEKLREWSVPVDGDFFMYYEFRCL